MAEAELDQRVRRVRVTNGFNTPFNDRFNGVPIHLEPGQSESLPLDMAAHFFGYHPGVRPEAMLRHIIKRQGLTAKKWTDQSPEAMKKNAEDYFTRFKIEPVFFKLVEEKSGKPDPKAPIPAEQEMAADDDEAPRRGPGRPRKTEAATDQA